MIRIFLKRILSERTIWLLSETLEQFNFFKYRLIKGNSLLIGLSIAFNRNYIREHKAFLEGAFIYENSRRNSDVNIHFLRRNVHRIEKGMIMQPRRDEFALRFIFQTVLAYKVVVEKSRDIFNSSELEWSYHVLEKYFDLVKSTNENYLKAKNIFESINVQIGNSQGTRKVPYSNINILNTVQYEDLLQLSKKRKSVRWFRDEPVSDDLINKALAIAALAPSSCNRQPYRYFISNKDKNLTTRIANISPGTIGWSENIPAIAVVIGHQKSFSNIANRHSIYVDGCLSVMPFVLALESMGICTCLINWSDIPTNEDKMSEILGLSKDEKVIVSIAIGYPEPTGQVAYSQRKYINEISKFI